MKDSQRIAIFAKKNGSKYLPSTSQQRRNERRKEERKLKKLRERKNRQFKINAINYNEDYADKYEKIARGKQ